MVTSVLITYQTVKPAE